MHTSDESQVATPGWTPFRLCVLADLEPGPDYALQGPRPLSCRRVTLAGFDRTLSQLAPAFRLVTADPLGGPELEVDVHFGQGEDLGLGGLLKCGPILSFLDALRAVECSTGHLDEQLARIFGARAAQLHALLPPPSRTTTPRHTTVDATGPSLPHHEILDGLLGLVDLPDSAPVLPRPAGTTDRSETAALDRKLRLSLATVLDALLSHTEYRRLTRAWRSIRTLCVAIQDCPWMELHVMTGFGATAESTASIQQLNPYLVVVEHSIPASARGVERLSSLADWADRQGIPVIATLGDDWLVAPNEQDDANRPTRAKLAQPALRLLDVVGARQSAQWLLLCANDVCDQGPVTKCLSKSDGPQYEQSPERLSSYAFLPAGIAAARCCIASLLQHGRPFPRAGSLECCMRSPAVRIVAGDGQHVAIGSRHLASQDDADYLASVGICCFVPTRNRDTVAPRAFPTAFRPRSASGDLGHPASTLGDQLFASRLARLMDHCRLEIQNGTPPTTAAVALENQIEALFPNAPPSGPEIRVTLYGDSLGVEVHPHRYEGLELQTIEATVRFA